MTEPLVVFRCCSTCREQHQEACRRFDGVQGREGVDVPRPPLHGKCFCWLELVAK